MSYLVTILKYEEDFQSGLTYGVHFANVFIRDAKSKYDAIQTAKKELEGKEVKGVILDKETIDYIFEDEGGVFYKTEIYYLDATKLL